MAKDSSFDIVSKVDLQEVDNALNQARKEIDQRFDFKGSDTKLDWNDKEITINTSDEFKVRNVVDISQEKLVKRGVSIKSLEFEKVESSLGSRYKQVIKIKQGIEAENARTIIKLIKDSKIKVQASVQDDIIRVSSKDKDDLQAIMQLIRNTDLPLSLQFTNYR